MADEKERSGEVKEDKSETKSGNPEITQNQSFNNDGASLVPGNKDKEEKDKEKENNNNNEEDAGK